MTVSGHPFRLIGWLKIVLPLVALAILSTLFLIARTIDLTMPSPTPMWTSKTDSRAAHDRTDLRRGHGGWSALTLAAAEAPSSRFRRCTGVAETLTGVLETPDGARTTLRLQRPRIDTTAREITLSGGVRLVSSSGWQIFDRKPCCRGMDRTSVISPARSRQADLRGM